MFHQHKKHILCGLSIGLLCIASEAAYTSLLDHSPFLSTQHAEVEIEPILNNSNESEVDFFHLKGIAKLGDRYIFSILDTRTKESAWIEPKDKINGFMILSYNTKTRSIIYEWNGKRGSTRIQERDGKVIPLIFVQEQNNIVSGRDGSSRSMNDQDTSISKPSVSIQTHDARQLIPNPHQSTSRSIEDSIVYFHTSSGLKDINSDSNDTPKPIATEIVESDSPLFASSDLPQTTQIDGANESAAPIKRFGRHNYVENPTGKKPDHEK